MPLGFYRDTKKMMTAGYLNPANDSNTKISVLMALDGFITKQIHKQKYLEKSRTPFKSLKFACKYLQIKILRA